MLVAAVVICLVGVLDDIFELPPLASSRVSSGGGDRRCAGCQDAVDPLPGQTVSLDGPASVAITVFFIVLCSNAVNFVDGLDGLATGVVCIGALAFFAYSYLLTVTKDLTRATTSSLITVAIAGACLGFLPHNFFPARMFMGDSGAMLLGLLLATSTISLTGQIDTSALRAVEVGWSQRCFLWFCRWPSWRYRSLDLVSPSSAGHMPADGGSSPTNSTCTTGCWNAVTASGGRDADVHLVRAGLLRRHRARSGAR